MVAVLCELMRPCQHYVMYYDDHCLVDTSWSIMMKGVVDYVKYDHIYLHASNVKVWCILGDHVRVWLCAYMCSLRVDAWMFLFDYVSL